MSKTKSKPINQQGFIPLSVPEISGNEWKYIKECLDTNWVSSAGQFVESFQEKVARFAERKYSVACVNGTSALHIALLLAGVKANEEIIIPAVTFVATANAVRYAGAWPAFIDLDPSVWQMDTEKLLDFLTKECKYRNGKLINKNTKRTIKAIMPVDMLGHPSDMDTILKIARKFSLKVIEDAAEGLGSLYKDKPVGAKGDIAVFSFNGNKIITTGGGGMILTNKKAWALRASYLITQARSNVLENIHDEVGYNYRLTNIQSAMGLAQMEKISEFVERKRKIAARYNEQLRPVQGIIIPKQAEWAESNYWLYTIFVNKAKYGMDSRKLLKALWRRKIQTRPLWHPLYRLKPFASCFAYKIKVADRLYKNCLSLPSSVGLGRKEQNKVIKAIKDLAKHKLN
ncbi:MAG: LegC family aminotransferase [Candidatus Omnitrophota bacterium]